MASKESDPPEKKGGYVWRTDLSFWSLLLANLALIVLYLCQGANFLEVAWVFWSQSVIIGFFTFLDLLTFRGSSGKDAVSPGNRAFIAFFFLVHYGIFHVVYFMFLGGFIIPYLFSFLVAANPSTGVSGAFNDVLGFLAIVGVFFVNHLFSFLYNRGRRAPGENLGTILFRPYVRIVPMHLTILFGGVILVFAGSSQVLLVFFLLVKTAVDLASHVSKHSGDELGVRYGRSGMYALTKRSR